MRFMNILSLAIAIAVLPINFALSADYPVYKDGLLTIPTISTADYVGQYQDVNLKLTEQGVWQLLSFKTLGASYPPGSPGLELGWPLIQKVEVVKTDTFPVQVFVRLSGDLSQCTSTAPSLGQINQRLENNRFDIMATSAGRGCPGNLVFFVRTISLPVYGLRAGIYSYNVNGTTGTFELTADNLLPGDTALKN